jgi:uncharacterized membrane protein YphA (DoxX/SURF4 family)
MRNASAGLKSCWKALWAGSVRLACNNQLSSITHGQQNATRSVERVAQSPDVLAATRKDLDMPSTKLKSIACWVSTTLIAAAFLLGGAVDAAARPPAVTFLAHLGYPAYFCTLIGVWKVLGGVALLAPRLPRLKEWAYAGTFFDVTGAAVSHAASGDSASHVLVPLALARVAFVSWGLRPQSRELGTLVPTATSIVRFTANTGAARA